MAQRYVGPTGTDKLSSTQYAMTLEEIGAVLGVTRERIRQIERDALNKLRRTQMTALLQMRDMANELRRTSGRSEHGVIA